METHNWAGWTQLEHNHYMASRLAVRRCPSCATCVDGVVNLWRAVFDTEARCNQRAVGQTGMVAKLADAVGAVQYHVRDEAPQELVLSGSQQPCAD